jgi:hypothetical protein
MKLALFAASVIYVIFYISYLFINKTGFLAVSVPIGVETIFILTFSFYYLYEQMNDTTTLFIYNKPPFWIILGIVLYLAGSFFIYLFASYLTADELKKFWVITNLFSILKNILFCIAIYINAKPSKEILQYDLELSSLH